MAISTFNVSLIPRFPASVVGDGPVTVDKSGLTYTLGFDITSYAENPTPSVNTRVLSYDPSSDTAGLIELSDFATPVIDARLADVPTAEAGVDNEKLITPLTAKASIVANAKDGASLQAGPNSVSQTLADAIYRNRYSVLDAGASPANSEAQNLDAFAKAASDLAAIGGGVLLVPHGATFELPKHTTSLTPVQQRDTLFNLPSNVTLENHGRINGAVLCVGDYVAKTNTVVGSGSIVKGVSTFAGNFAAYAPGDIAMIELQGLGGNVANGEGGGINVLNQFGVDFLTVTAADGTGLTTTETTRWPYNAWKISKVPAQKVSGALARGASSISGDYTAFLSVGDWVRIENLNGSDTMWTAIGKAVDAGYPALSTQAYFEYVKVKSISAASVVFEQTVAYTYTDFWLARADPRENVGVRGGFVKSVITEAVSDCRWVDFDCEEFGIKFNFDGECRNILSDTDGPYAARFSNSRGLVIDGIRPRGSTSSTGNANCKFLSMVGCNISNVVTDDATSSGSGCFGLQTDLYYTPYSPWMQDCSLSNIVADNPKGSTLLAMWIAGTRDCIFNGLKAAGEVEFSLNVGLVASAVSSQVRIDLLDCIAPQLHNFRAPFVNPMGVPDGVIGPGVVAGTGGANSNRVLWARNGTSIANSDGISIHGVKCLSQTAADTFIFLTNAADAFIDGCSDKTGITNSVTLGANVGGLHVGVNQFKNTSDISGLQTSTISSGVVTVRDNSVRQISLLGEGGVADALDSLSGGILGQIVTLCAASNTVDITVNNSLSPGFRLASTFVMNNSNDTITLVKVTDTVWREIARSDNGA